MSRIVFLDTETTGLDPATEDVFEVAIIDGTDEHVFRLEPRPAVVDRMHPKAAEVNRFHQRIIEPGWEWDHDPHRSLMDIFDLLDGAHICGAVPDFDARHLTALYQRAMHDVPRWHYHLIDVEALAVGYLCGRYGRFDHLGETVGPPVEAEGEAIRLPWKSDDLSRACGVEPPGDEDRHTALGDARWAKRLYEAITGEVSQ